MSSVIQPQSLLPKVLALGDEDGPMSFAQLSSPVAMGTAGASQSINTSNGLNGRRWLPSFLLLAFDTKNTRPKEHLKLGTHVPVASPPKLQSFLPSSPNPNCSLS